MTASWHDEGWKVAAKYEASPAYKKLFAKFEKDLKSGKFDKMKMKGSHWPDEKQENWVEFKDLNHGKKLVTIGVYRGHKPKYDGYEYEIGGAFGFSELIFVPGEPAHKGMEDAGTKRIKSLYNMKKLKKTDPKVIDTLIRAGKEAEWMSKVIDSSREGT